MVQTTVGTFSSGGGWNSTDPNRIQVNVQPPSTQAVFASVTDPVALKWTGTNLYVLSGSGATITEYSTNGTAIGTLSGLGSNPTGFDVDGAGNIYVAMTSSNQVWKFISTNGTYVADTNFGNGGFIGATNGATGTTNGQLNAPFGIALSPGGGTISVSDSGNNRIQQFSTVGGAFITAFGTNGADIGQLNDPKGLAYDSVGNLYIVDSGNDRLVVVSGVVSLGVNGTNGTALGQFSGPDNISIGERGIYVADTGNNRIQAFNLLGNGVYTLLPSDVRFAVSGGLSNPADVAALDNLTNETFYVADTGNNRILLYSFNPDDPTSTWNNMLSDVTNGDIPGAISCFSGDTADNYRQSFLVIGASDLAADLGQIGPLTPVFVKSDSAEYYFEKDIEGHTILFPVEFTREDGVWKIISF